MSEDARREEVRGLFTLGLMAILLTIRLNLEPNYEITIGELRAFRVGPIIDGILVTWGLYAFFMIFGYSTDIFSSETCNTFKKIGRFCLIANILVLSAMGLVVAIVNIKTVFLVILYFFVVFLAVAVYDKVKEVYKAKKKSKRKSNTNSYCA